MYRKFLFFFFVIAGNIAFGQNELKFDFDYAKFNYDSNSVYLEFYYSLNPQTMEKIEKPNGKFAEAIVHIEMKNAATDSFFINKDWKIESPVESDSSSTSRNLSGVYGFQVPEGKYSLFVKAWDANNPKLIKTINESIEIKPYTKEKFSISDIELASNIKKVGADPKSIFYKNTLEVIPNPSMLYSAQTPVAFYYAELYNLVLEDTSGDFTLQKLVFNSIGKNVFKNVKTVKQAQNSVVEIGLVNLSKLPTDSYNLVFSLIDNKTNQAYISSKRFFLYNPNVVDTSAKSIGNTSLLSSAFGVMTAEECDQMFSESKYIATQPEIDKYKNLDSLDAKRNFLLNFWKSRDTDPSTPQNEFQNDYMRRVEYANKNFKFSQTPGYLSDRGRIYLTYGEPDQKDYYPSEPNLKPYEIWFYNNIESGVSFMFGDVTGFGKFELLNSTKRGEIRDDNWKRRLSAQ
jgi:GWxTD domain-containing protein